MKTVNDIKNLINDMLLETGEISSLPTRKDQLNSIYFQLKKYIFNYKPHEKADLIFETYMK